MRRAPSGAACPIGMQPGQPGVRHHELRRLRIASRQSGIHVPKSQPIRHSLLGGLPGAPSTARRGRACSRSPGSKRSAQASGMKAQRGETPSVARCAARQRDPTPPGDAWISVETAMRLYLKPQKHETTFTHWRKHTEPHIRRSDVVSMHEYGFTCPCQAVHPQTRQSAKQVKRKKVRNRLRTTHLLGFVKRLAARRGVRATLSRPCCATRSGCVCRPRLQPAGRRWSPGTTDHPGSPTDRADPPC